MESCCRTDSMLQVMDPCTSTQSQQSMLKTSNLQSVNQKEIAAQRISLMVVEGTLRATGWVPLGQEVGVIEQVDRRSY